MLKNSDKQQPEESNKTTQPKSPWVEKWIKKWWYIYTTEHYSAIEKEILSLETAWVDLEHIMLSEISQSQKDKYHVISFICRI